MESFEYFNHTLLDSFLSHVVNFPSPDDNEEAEEGELRVARKLWIQPFVDLVHNLAQRR